MSYVNWCKQSEQALASEDIAAVNLALAAELPGVKFDSEELLARLDCWTNAVRQTTGKALIRRSETGKYRDMSAAMFRMFTLIEVLRHKFGVTYNLAFSQGEYDARDSRNLFLHGLLTGHGGTCVTMPVLYAAIGRRLGYPIKLVYAKQHVFCRWDSPQERFNIESTSPGFNPRPDSYYRTWPFPLSGEDVASGIYLTSLTARRERALFLCNRGHYCIDQFCNHEAIEAYWFAHQLDPAKGYDLHLNFSYVMRRFVDEFRKQCQGVANRTLRMPPPRDAREAELYPACDRNLRRIFANIEKEKRCTTPR